MKNVTLLLLTVLIISNKLYPQSYQFKGFELNESNENFHFEFSIPQIDSTLIEANNYNYVRYSIQDYGLTSDEGYPQLPVVCFNVIIPMDVVNCKINILNKQTSEVYISKRIYPAQKGKPRIVPLDKREFSIQSSYYNSNGGKYEDLVQVSEPFILRGIKGVCVSVFPFDYSPLQNKIIIATEIEFELTFKSNCTKITSTVTTSYSDYFNHFFVNYNSINLKSGSTEDFLIIASDEFQGSSELDAFIYNKSILGYNVNVFFTDETGVTVSRK